MADKEKGNNPLPKSPLSRPPSAIFFLKKFHDALVFSDRMIIMIIARTVSLSTGKNGYGETVIRPHPEEGRVTLRTEHQGNLLWH
jgi:hypothetical protein